MNSSLHALAAASALALLSACGGGGDDSPAVPTNPTVSISSANQTNVARASVNAGLSLAMAQGALGSGQSVAPDAAGRAHAMIALVRQAMANAGRKSAASLDAHPAAVHSATSNCASGGTITSAWDDKDGNSNLSSGDVITATFAQCADSATNTVNGTVVITLTATPVINSTSTQIAVNAQFQSLAVVNGGSSYTVNGTVAVAESDNDTTSQSTFTLTVGASDLTATLASSGYNDTVTFRQGLTVNEVVAFNGSSQTLAIAGMLQSAMLGGQVSIITPLPLSGSGVDAYPSSGEMVITGVSGSRLDLTVLSNAQVQMALDANGDGTVDSTTTVAWSTLVP